MKEQFGLWGGSVELQDKAKTGVLAERFVVPPFSILDARQSYWQERKRVWGRLGIRGELGRGSSPGTSARATAGRKPTYREIGGEPTFGAYAGGSRWPATNYDGQRGEGTETGTSIFDPVLCELAYRWFCPEGGHVLDPFAGGSVRGIVAEHLGYRYTGIELRSEQVRANRVQATALDLQPRWIIGDSLRAHQIAPGEYDFIFSCPPYYDLEVYSDLLGELSALPSYDVFIAAYRRIISQCLTLLRPNRFACFVVGDMRDKRGYYRNFVSDTIAAFRDAGTQLYNEAILITSLGSLPIRVGKQFKAGRKLGKTHQNVLVFCKGDWRQAVAALGGAYA